MKALYRLKAKKAFTLVELIVVLAIIGVMAGIMLPMFANSGKPQEAAAKAKSFYFTAQNIFIDFKASKPVKSDSEPYIIYDAANNKFVDSLPAGAQIYGSGVSSPYIAPVDKNPTYSVPTYMFLCAKAEKEKGYTNVWFAVNSNATADNPENYAKLLYTTTSTPAFDSSELKDKFNAYSQPEDNGYYFALIDSQCRVVMTYWSPVDIETLFNESANPASNSLVFTDNDTVSVNYIVGSYPLVLGMKDRIMFDAG